MKWYKTSRELWDLPQSFFVLVREQGSFVTQAADFITVEESANLVGHVILFPIRQV